MALYTLLATLGLLAAVSAYEMQPATISLLSPQGLRMSYPVVPGMTLYAVHYSINKPLPGVVAGDWNFDINSPTGNEFVHENRDVVVKPGDIVNYWHLAIINGGGFQLLEQRWVATEPTSGPKPTTPPPTTPPPTTTRPTAGPTQPPTTRPTNPPTDRPTGPTNPPGPSTTRKPCDGGGDCEDKEECESYPCLVFEDEFDTLDFHKWQHEITAGGGGNWEFQLYTNNRSNSYVRDGTLFIKPTLLSDTYNEAFLSSGILDIWGNTPSTMCTGPGWYGCFRQGSGSNFINPIQSARLRTAESFTLRYGKVEVVAKLPEGDWIWPAIWMLPRYDEYGGWPASGEIDIMESRGNENLKSAQGEDIGCNHMGATLHWGPSFNYNRYQLTASTKNGNFAGEFHKYAVEWDEDGMRFFINNEQILKVDPGNGGFWDFGGFTGVNMDNPWSQGSKMAPFDREFYLILNVAVGGTNGFFPDNAVNGNGPKPWSNEGATAPRDFWQGKKFWYPTWKADVNNGEGAAMQIKSVHVWKLKDN